MLKKLLKFMEADPQICRGKKGFTLEDAVGGSPIFIAGDPTWDEMEKADHEEKQWKEKNVRPLRCLLEGLHQLGYVKSCKGNFTFIPSAYRFLKSRSKKASASS